MSVSLTPLSDVMGVEVAGLDLREAVSEAVGAALRGAMREHRLVLPKRDDLAAVIEHHGARVIG